MTALFSVSSLPPFFGIFLSPFYFNTSLFYESGAEVLPVLACKNGREDEEKWVGQRWLSWCPRTAETPGCSTPPAALTPHASQSAPYFAWDAIVALEWDVSCLYFMSLGFSVFLFALYFPMVIPHPCSAAFDGCRGCARGGKGTIPSAQPPARTPHSSGGALPVCTLFDAWRAGWVGVVWCTRAAFCAH